MYFTLTIYNIRSQKMKKSNLRRFSRSKTAADKDVKFYIQIALILGIISLESKQITVIYNYYFLRFYLDNWIFSNHILF